MRSSKATVCAMAASAVVMSANQTRRSMDLHQNNALTDVHMNASTDVHMHRQGHHRTETPDEKSL